jgi:RNA polymerase sigma-70 factor (ECF subfamily)
MTRATLDRAYWAGLLGLVKRYTHGNPDAEDLLQSAYVRMEDYRAQQSVDNPRAFLVQTAVNISIDQHRREKVRGSTGGTEDWDQAADEAPLPDEVLEARERLLRVNEGLDKLPTRTREILLMHRLDGMTYREIAAHYRISPSAVEKHISRAMLFLAQWTRDW